MDEAEALALMLKIDGWHYYWTGWNMCQTSMLMSSQWLAHNRWGKTFYVYMVETEESILAMGENVDLKIKSGFIKLGNMILNEN